MQLAFIGYGELSQQLSAFILRDTVTKSEYFDDELYKMNVPNSHPFAEYENDIYKEYSFVVGLGYKNLLLKQRIIKNLEAKGREISGFIHTSCYVSSSSIIGKGSFLYPMCNIDKEVRTGNGVLLNNSVVVSHNSVIGDCCYISPGVVISGSVTIGENTFIGAGSIISNGISIGKNVIIGIGSVITKDIPDNNCAIGNPMKIVDKLKLK